MKRKTNKQLLQRLVREANDIDLALVVSQLTAQADKVLSQKDELRESMKNSIIHPDLWIRHNETLKEYLEN